MMRMKRREFLVMTGATAAGAKTALAEVQQTDRRFDELAKLISEKMAEHHVPGVAFGVMKNGVTATRGFGVTNTEDPLPITADTVFPIASISKTFATTAIMNLIHQGKVELKAPVHHYLPDFRVVDE